ncbi:MAG: solute-binding transport protein [Chloroflexi bacterium]|jgi:ABC-type glycerol-3-phosphate transport system substrate-binding protein|nr:solute-binding transport protein [Chloroflexota bacterium]MDB5076427.1 solute-binding transport protein [Chloroflexota bacterium]
MSIEDLIGRRELKRRDLLKLAAAATGAAAASRLTGPAAAAFAQHAAGNTTITVEALPGTVGPMWSADAVAWNKSHAAGTGITLKVRIPGGSENDYKVLFPHIAASSAAPDMCWYWFGGAGFYNQMASAGLFVPLDDLYKSQGWDHVLPDAAVKGYVAADGHRYGVVDNVVWYPQLYYRKDAFKKAGIKAPPSDHPYFDSEAEFLDAIDRLRHAGYDSISIGGVNAFMLAHVEDVLLQRMTPEPFVKNLRENWLKSVPMTYRYTDPRWLAVNQKMVDWKNKGVFATGFMGRTELQAMQYFATGKAALYSDGSWASGKGMLGGFAKSLDFAWMLYPKMVKEIEPKFLLYMGNAEEILTHGKHVDAAKKILAYHMSLERQTALARSGILTPARLDIPANAMKGLGVVGYDMWKQLGKVGSAIGWDDPVATKLGQLNYTLMSQLMAGSIGPKDVGTQLQTALIQVRAGS